ncbi:MAG: aminoacyl-tRNA hydrolase [Alphaproteobacteria bacterium]|nr:aminoacyl-tRNA hydrolase [Alphaproteobacteria bacterium]
MLLLVGLGNPGTEHERHRHNVGFMALERIRARHRFGAERRRFHGALSEGALDGQRALALRPLTYMNDSGQAVGEAARFHKLEPAAIVVLHDELDLAPGKVRVKTGGGHAGHNGLRSLDAHLGKDYRRVRIGIGHPGDPARVHHYVLSDFAKAERVWLDALLDAIAEAAPLLAMGKDSAFASKVALLTRPPREKKAAKPGDGI